MVQLPPRKSKGEQGKVAAGDYVIYSVTGTLKGSKVNGGLGVRITKVTEDNYFVEVMPRRVPFLKKAKLEFPYDGKNLADLGGVVAGWSVLYSGTYVGTESIPTPFGEKVLEHYMKIDEMDSGTLRTDQFVDPAYHFPFAASMGGKSGEVLFGIVETNMEWIKTL